MPFMRGSAPIRRTLQYLRSGKLEFRESVKILTINYNTKGDHHKGTRDFVFWYLPQIQYKNPSVQIVTFKNLTPSPFLRCYLDDGRQILMDVDSKQKDEILSHLQKIVGKSKMVLAEEAKQREKKENPANFGADCDRHCMCEVSGQVPCPAVVKLPNPMRGKYKYNKLE